LGRDRTAHLAQTKRNGEQSRMAAVSGTRVSATFAGKLSITERAKNITL
jgi:hypothetical protein